MIRYDRAFRPSRAPRYGSDFDSAREPGPNRYSPVTDYGDLYGSNLGGNAYRARAGRNFYGGRYGADYFGARRSWGSDNLTSRESYARTGYGRDYGRRTGGYQYGRGYPSPNAGNHWNW